jgi:GrpB-like predicted nucleotidyltransferase (UPF0157 family)
VVVNELVWSDGLLADAARVRDEVAGALAALGVPGELVLTGGSSVPGALTRGDVDLHLRVDPESFRQVVDRLGGAYPVASAHAWGITLAVFDVPGRHPTGLAVTPVGSEHDDRFRTTWRALRRDPVLLAEYNALKAATAGTPAYEARKSDFFSRVVAGEGQR